MTQPKPILQKKLKEIRRLKKAKKFAEAEVAGCIACRRFPKNKTLLSEHADTAVRQERWASAFKRLNLLLAYQEMGAAAEQTIHRLVAIYISLGQPGEARLRVAQALEECPGSFALRKTMAELHLLRPEGAADPGLWRDLAAAPELDSADDAIRVKVVAACVAGLRLAGCAAEARELLARHYRPENPAWQRYIKDGYAKVVVYDNGRTRLEYYSKLFDVGTLEIVESIQLAATFDIMGQSWTREPFVYKPLAPKAVDFLSLRKRSRSDFHQDFTRAEYLRIAVPIAVRYPDCVAFGQSLGGYSALYYGCWLPGCRVLASAPRNPQHPLYSTKRYARYDLFRHEYDMPRNESATPTIVYDPKNSLEGPYIEKSLRHTFPNAKFVPYPHCGHSITRYLLDVGILKSSTLGFCEGVPFPDFDRKLRGRSPEYLRNLARANFAAGRKRWAIALLARALELGNNREMTELLIARIDPPPPPLPASRFERLKKWLIRRVLRRKKKKKSPPVS